jgi:hypothetical protein
MKKQLREYIMSTRLFWKIWFWWGIRKAMKERKIKEAEDAKRPYMTNDEYWEKVHNDRTNSL